MMRRYGLFVLFFLLWGISLASGVMWGGFGPWFLVGSIGFLLSYVLLQHVLILRKMKADVRVSATQMVAGEAVEVHVTIKQTGFLLPISWLAIRDVWSDTDGRDAYRCTRLLFPGFRRNIDYRYSIKNIDRGIYGQHRVELGSGDRFGLLKRTQIVQSPASLKIIALPRPVHPPDFFGAHGHSVKQVHHPKHWNQTSRTASIRDYRAGDPLRLIHWKATARTGDWKTVETETELCSRVVVYLDTSRWGNDADSGRGTETSGERVNGADGRRGKETSGGHANGVDSGNETNGRSANGVDSGKETNSGRVNGVDSGNETNGRSANDADTAAMFEATIQVAAGLLTQAAKRGARLRLAVTGEGKLSRSIEVGPGSLPSLLVELAGITLNADGVRGLTALLRSEGNELKAGTAVLCVTAMPDEALAAICAQLARGQRSISICHVLPMAVHGEAERPGESWRSRFAEAGCAYAAVTAATSTAREVRRDDASA
ncbi:MAG: DUF58 domain-containing protein [Gorillibacterium sp.]|nr:DUF58 domain-containing protein [Gorillibacterium sp.]